MSPTTTPSQGFPKQQMLSQSRIVLFEGPTSSSIQVDTSKMLMRHSTGAEISGSCGIPSFDNVEWTLRGNHMHFHML